MAYKVNLFYEIMVSCDGHRLCVQNRSADLRFREREERFKQSIDSGEL